MALLRSVSDHSLFCTFPQQSHHTSAAAAPRRRRCGVWGWSCPSLGQRWSENNSVRRNSSVGPELHVLPIYGSGEAYLEQHFLMSGKKSFEFMAPF
jgi:hypothetical protein